MTADGPRTGVVSNIVAIVGFVILAVIVIWGLISLASKLSPRFGSLFNRSTEKGISVTVPASVPSGEVAPITWSYASKNAGTYAILYKCAPGLQLALPGPENEFIPIPCGAAFGLGSATSSIVVRPTSSATSSVGAQITLLYIPQIQGTTEPEATGSATMTVTPAIAPVPTTPKPTTPTTPTTPTPSGASDLAVTIVSVATEPGGAIAVQFNISNIGSGTSGTYAFTAQLPTSIPYTYVSPPQSPLGPGDYIVNTLRFTQPIPGNIFVSVDPNNLVRESNESNNSASNSVSAYYGGQYPYYGY